MWGKDKSKIESLEEYIEELEAQVMELSSPTTEIALEHTCSHSPKNCLESILGSVSWYDYHELTPIEQENYRMQARQVVDNPVFVNELNHLFQVLALKSLTEPQSLEQLRDIQQSGVTIESIKSHLLSIATPLTAKEEPYDPNEGI